jgi:prepilin-type N-terminal cleavage/methylation domain-containing protein
VLRTSPRTIVWNETSVGTLVGNRTHTGTAVRNLVGTFCGNQRGFSLIESVVASAVLVVTLAGLASLFVQSAHSAANGRRAPVALAAAASKLDQLLALDWTYDASGTPLSDLTRDTSRDPPAASGGTGLSLSPEDSLARDTAGFVDYITGDGGSVGSTPAAGALLARRWRIRPWPGADADALLIRVCVTRTIGGNSGDPMPEVCLGTARVRR